MEKVDPKGKITMKKLNFNTNIGSRRLSGFLDNLWVLRIISGTQSIHLYYKVRNLDWS